MLLVPGTPSMETTPDSKRTVWSLPLRVAPVATAPAVLLDLGPLITLLPPTHLVCSDP